MRRSPYQVGGRLWLGALFITPVAAALWWLILNRFGIL